jgi:hypothetical protein
MTEEWPAPFPYGYKAASESVGSVAAPLLAGFSFALVGLVIPSPDHLRWPNLALVPLVAGGAAFIAAVQCSFWARQYAISPDDIKLWRPGYSPGRIHALLRGHDAGFKKWNARMNYSYRAGIVLLLLGVMFALVPPGHIDALRALSVGVAALAAVGELGWIFATWFLDGSPSMVYNDESDVPESGTRFRKLRSSKLLRAFAREYVPLPRIQVTPEERQ